MSNAAAIPRAPAAVPAKKESMPRETTVDRSHIADDGKSGKVIEARRTGETTRRND